MGMCSKLFEPALRDEISAKAEDRHTTVIFCDGIAEFVFVHILEMTRTVPPELDNLLVTDDVAGGLRSGQLFFVIGSSRLF
mmetsp:Transcript_12880/g.41511  ORF Transcript_12880/g.41511 Transcript_12880/m.41511 type:complete len:81 (+) Transcript_12880:165-407(+)